jgi:hypothetical protein
LAPCVSGVIKVTTRSTEAAAINIKSAAGSEFGGEGYGFFIGAPSPLKLPIRGLGAGTGGNIKVRLRTADHYSSGGL